MAVVDSPVALPSESTWKGAATRGRVLNKSVDIQRFRQPPPDPDQTRHEVTSIVVRWYLGLLSVVIMTPVYLLVFKGLSADDAQKVVVALSSALTGLAGLLGLVIAFYFKEREARDSSRDTPLGNRRAKKTTRAKRS